MRISSQRTGGCLNYRLRGENATNFSISRTLRWVRMLAGFYHWASYRLQMPNCFLFMRGDFHCLAKSSKTNALNGRPRERQQCRGIAERPGGIIKAMAGNISKFYWSQKSHWYIYRYTYICMYIGYINSELFCISLYDCPITANNRKIKNRVRWFSQSYLCFAFPA